jgi:RNA-directed DNA polymerase
MKRIGGLFESISSLENLRKADRIAQKGKSKQKGVIQHNKNSETNLLSLQEKLLTKTFVTSAYSTFTITDPKERVIFKLPYYPDRIVHHAVMNILEPIFMQVFTADTYSCIKGRGVHGAVRKLKKVLTDYDGTKYCLKLDIRKFYPSIDHDILKSLLRKKIKDNDLLHLLDEIIDSTEGLPIGNYLSSYLANFYVTYFDHWIKEKKLVKRYFRYADDMIILHESKEYLHQLFIEIEAYLQEHLKLTVKRNYQVFPVEDRGIDFLGYRFFHTYILLRKRIKKNFVRKLKSKAAVPSIASYMGWAKHCDSRHLLKRLNKGGAHEIEKTKPPNHFITI